MKGGDAHNVIPEKVSFGGTFRSLTTEGFSYLMKRIKEVNNEHQSVAVHDQSKFTFIYCA
jgi:IAA-amino acid hydrolase